MTILTIALCFIPTGIAMLNSDPRAPQQYLDTLSAITDPLYLDPATCAVQRTKHAVLNYPVDPMFKDCFK